MFFVSVFCLNIYTLFFCFQVWIMATAQGELLACQPYAGNSTQIADYGLGQGPNMVMGLTEQFGLVPGSRVSIKIFRK